MSKATWRSPEGRKQAAALALFSLVPIVAASSFHPSHSRLFRRYFGDVDALAAVALITIVGAVALVLARTYGGFRIYEAKRTFPGIGLSAVLATTFAVGAIAVADVIVSNASGRATTFHTFGFTSRIIRECCGTPLRWGFTSCRA